MLLLLLMVMMLVLGRAQSRGHLSRRLLGVPQAMNSLGRWVIQVLAKSGRRDRRNKLLESSMLVLWRRATCVAHHGHVRMRPMVMGCQVASLGWLLLPAGHGFRRILVGVLLLLWRVMVRDHQRHRRGLTSSHQACWLHPRRGRRRVFSARQMCVLR